MNAKKVEQHIKKKILPVVDAGSPDGEYLHYRLYVEDDILKLSLHRCQLIWDKANSNYNKNLHEHKFYMRLRSLLLT